MQSSSSAYCFFLPRSQLFLGAWLFLVGLCLGAPAESPSLAQPISLSKVARYWELANCFKSFLRSLFFPGPYVKRRLWSALPASWPQAVINFSFLFHFRPPTPTHPPTPRFTKKLKEISFKKLKVFRGKKANNSASALENGRPSCYQAKPAKHLETDLNLDTGKTGRGGREERGSREGRQDHPLLVAGHGSKM